MFFFSSGPLHGSALSFTMSAESMLRNARLFSLYSPERKLDLGKFRVQKIDMVNW